MMNAEWGGASIRPVRPRSCIVIIRRPLSSILHSAFFILHSNCHDPPAPPDIFRVLVPREEPAGEAAARGADLAAVLPRRAVVRRPRPGGGPVPPAERPGVPVRRAAGRLAYRRRGLGPGRRAARRRRADAAGSHPDPLAPVLGQPDRRRRPPRRDRPPAPPQAAHQAEDAEPLDERAVPAHPPVGPGPVPRPLDAAGPRDVQPG